LGIERKPLRELRGWLVVLPKEAKSAILCSAVKQKRDYRVTVLVILVPSVIWKEESQMNALEILGQLAVSLVGGAVTLLVAIRTGKVELKKRKPETIMHQCRLAHHNIYTFIKGDKKQTPPLCAYLDPSDYMTCHFDPEYHHTEDLKTDALRMKEINQNQCYIARFNEKFDLI